MIEIHAAFAASRANEPGGRRRAFRSDTGGSVATVFAIGFLPAMLITGAAIDYSRSVTQWSNLQQAADATALSIAHTFLTTTSTQSATLAYAQSYIAGLMYNSTVTSVTLSGNNTQVCLTANFTVNTAVMNIVGIKTVPVSTQACAQTNGTVEVALALDNSGSMLNSAGGVSKISALQTAAKQLVDILIPSGTTNPSASVSLVPFTSMVNVGGGTNSPTYGFLDKTGLSSLHWQNWNTPSGASFTPTSKFDLFAAMKNTTWAGCVEERPYPYVTTDTAASTGNGDSLFVPYLAPDEPGATNNSYGYTCYPNSNCSNSNAYINSYISDSGSSTTAGVCTGNDKYSKADNATSNIYPGSAITEVCKYKGTTPANVTTALGNGSGSNFAAGPNLECILKPITPLNTNGTTLKTAVDAMTAGGGTNLVAGFMWAWRTISPTVSPFPTTSTALIGPQNPKAYTGTTPPNAKYIILMTDGMNSWTANGNDGMFKSIYEGFGYYAFNRLTNYNTSNLTGGQSCSGSSTSSSNSRCELENATLEACQNAKNASVTIFTVGFSTTSDPIDAAGQALLQNCASGTSNYYPAANSADLQTAFQQIAARIQNLRLTQ